MGIARKLDYIHRGLVPLLEQSKVLQFLASTENAQIIDNLTEDIREALMEYQVHTSNYPFSTMSDAHVRLHCNKAFMTTVISSL